MRISLSGLYRWGYTMGRELSFLTNVIQCQCGNRYKKMLGLFNLYSAGREVRSGNNIDRIRIDGDDFGICELEKFAVKA